MIFILLRKLNDSSDVFANMEFQTLFFTAVQLFPFTHTNTLNKLKKIHGWIKLLTFEPRSLNIISTSKILPNCCKEIEKLHENKVTSTLLSYTVQMFVSENGAAHKKFKEYKIKDSQAPKKKQWRGARSILQTNRMYHYTWHYHSTDAFMNFKFRETTWQRGNHH